MFPDQLRKAWESKGTISNEEWLQQAGKLKKVIDELNDYVTRIHQIFPNGLSPFLAMCMSVANDELPVANLRWPSASYHSREDLERLNDIVDRLSENFGPVEGLRNKGIGIIRTENWSPAWARELIEAAKRLDSAIEELRRDTAELQSLLTGKPGSINQKQLSSLGLLASALLKSHGKDISVAFSPDAVMRLEAANRGLELLSSYQTIENGLSCKYADLAWKVIDIDGLSAQYEESRIENGLYHERSYLHIGPHLSGFSAPFDSP